MRPEKGRFLRPSLVASQVGGRNLSVWFDKLTMQFDKLTMQFDKLTMQFDKLTMQFDKLTMQFDKLTMQLDKHIKNRVCRLCSISERPHGGRTRQEIPPHQPAPARGEGESNVLPKISDYSQTGKPNPANA